MGGEMTEPDEFSVRFWGVRGSIACAGAETLKYGGNTSCLEVRCGTHLLIFDAGTGIRPLGRALHDAGPIDADIFFSHSHFDHVCGLPFFSPLYFAENSLRMWAGHLLPEIGLEEILRRMMAAPLFPVPKEIFAATVGFNDFTAGETLAPRPGIEMRTALLNHPNRATGYRIDFAGRSLCYITDTTHIPNHPDAAILELIDGADIVIYDSTFTDDEFAAWPDIGHSSWQEGMRLCDAASVGTLVIFHHHPDHDDDFMDAVATAAAAQRPGTIVAREGTALSP